MAEQDGWQARGRVLMEGTAAGEVLVLDHPLSFWGGFDPGSGEIIDRRHPQAGLVLSGRVLAMPGGRGSSSSSSVLAEALRAGTGPAAIVLARPDEIVVLGALVVRLLYELRCPVVLLEAADYDRLRDGDAVTVEDGWVAVSRR